MGNYIPDYLVFRARESGTFTFTYMANVPAALHTSISYSLNGRNWVTANNVDSQEVTLTTPTIPEGGKVYWKGTGYGMCRTRSSVYCYFSSTGNFDIDGNIMSILYGDAGFESKKRFERLTGSGVNYNDVPVFDALFKGAKIVNVGKNLLPATTLVARAYNAMFQNCTLLVSVPDLPATTTTVSCYSSMFQGCSSLVSAQSILPAQTLATGCYTSMFMSCTSLLNAPELPATVLVGSCYSNMFYGCSKLETAPVLPAKTLAASCYLSMFDHCTKLSYIKALFTAFLSGATNNWVRSVNGAGTFVKAADATWENTFGASAVPTNFTVVTE